MATQNKTISELCSTINIDDNDLILMSKNVSTTTTSEYVSYNIKYNTLVDAIWQNNILNRVNTTINDKLFKKLAYKDFLNTCKWSNDNDPDGIIPSSAILPTLQELAFKNKSYLNLDHLAREYNAEYKKDLKLSTLASIDYIDLSKHDKVSYLYGKLPISAVDTWSYNNLILSTENDLSLNRLGKIHYNEYVRDLNLKQLAHEPWISLTSVGTTANDLLRDKLPIHAVDGLLKFCSADNVNLGDSSYITVPANVLALSTYEDLNLGDLASKGEKGLNLKALAHEDSIALTSNFLTDKLPISKIDEVQFEKFINNEVGNKHGYHLKNANSTTLGGIRTGYTENVLGLGNFGVQSNTHVGENDNIAYVHIDDATLTQHGLMSANDKKKLDSAITANYTLTPATNTTLGGIKVSANKVITGKLTYVQTDTDNMAYVDIPELQVASASTLGGIKIGYPSSSDNREYAVLEKNGYAYVKVPWVDASGGTGLAGILAAIYPTGAIYITTNTVCPLERICGHWEVVSQGRCLMGANSLDLAGAQIDAGLPSLPTYGATTNINNMSINVTGTTDSAGSHTHTVTYQVANCSCGNEGGIRSSHTSSKKGSQITSSTGSHSHTINVSGTASGTATTTIYSSGGSSLYGASTTVLPNALYVNIFKRVS